MATPEETAASFDALNETLRQIQDTLGPNLESLSTSMRASADVVKQEATERRKSIEDAKKEADAHKDMNEQIKRLQDAYGDAYEIQGKLNDKGKKEIKVLDKAAAQRERENQLNDEIYAQVKERLGLTDSLTQADKEAYILAEKENIQKKKSQKLLEDELRQIGKKLDENGRIINIDKQLLAEDEKKLAQAKKQYRIEEENRQTLENVGESLTKFAKDLGALGLATAFDFLKASVIGTYKAQVAYEDALLAGETGYSVQAAAIAAQMNEMSGAMDKLGGGLVTLGTETVATGIKMALAGGPIGLLVVAVGALLAVFGYAAQVEAENMKRTAELKKKQAALFDELFKDFGALGEASMGSSRGMTGLKDDLAKVGLTIKEFEKLNSVLKANSKEMSMLGAGTVGGIKNFLDVTGGLISSELGKTFREMGIDRDAMMDHTAKYMAQEQRFGLMQEKSIKDQAKAAGAYVVELDKMAALTGATRKEQEAAREAVMQIQSLRAAMMKARASGDTQEAERLKRYLDVATAFQAQGMTEQAKGTVELAAGKGPTSEASAMVMQASPQMVEMLDKNIGTTMERYAVGLKEFKDWALNFADAASVGADMSKLVGDYGKIDDANIKLEQLVELQKKNPTKSLDELLVEMRKNKDSETTKRVEEEEKQRKAAIETQNKLLNGQELASQTMTNASNGFWDGVKKFMDGVLKFMKAVVEFAKHPLDSIKEAFTGKDKSQRDAEELEEVSKRIEGLKKALGNPDEAKKLAEDNLALAKKEFDAKDKAVTDLNIAYNKERDVNKRKEIEQKQILAEDEREAARRKKVIAETALTDAEKAKRDNNPEKIKKQLEGLETRKKELTEAVKTNEPSKTTPAAKEAPAPGTPQTENDLASTRSKRQGAPATAPSDTAPEAPKKELGGIVPGTIDGTTVTVGEKGKPEAIMPLDAISGMLNTISKSPVGEKGKPETIMPLDAISGMLNTISKSSVGEKDKPETISSVDKFAGMVDINKDLFNINAKDFEISVKQFDLAKVDTNLKELSNKLTEKQTAIIDEKLIKSMNAETDTNNKLIISMNKVTEMLPNTLAQIIAATSGTNGAAGGGTGAAPAGAPTAGGGATAPGSVDSLKQAGLILKKGDVQAEGKEIDPRLIEIAKQVQASVPGFMQFTGFNDEFHNENSPGSKHTKGKAFDFVLNRAPSKEEGAKILAQLKSLGIDYAQDEYNNPSSASTGGHIHGQLNAFDGGVFEPRPGGVHVNLAEAGLREAAVPLNPGEKIRVEKSEQENNPPKKDPLSTVLANDSQSGAKSDQAAQILSALHELMESKFDSMISAIKDGNDISDKLLKYSQV